jgi:hypothetical protein
MKFRDIREYVSGELVAWVRGELNAGIRELFIGLRRLSFEDNFESFEYTGSIAATTEISVQNKFSFIPSRYLVVDTTSGAVVGRGPTAWTSDRLFIKNYSASATVAKIVFMR